MAHGAVWAAPELCQRCRARVPAQFCKRERESHPCCTRTHCPAVLNLLHKRIFVIIFLSVVIPSFTAQLIFFCCLCAQLQARLEGRRSENGLLRVLLLTWSKKRFSTIRGSCSLQPYFSIRRQVNGVKRFCVV